MAMKIEELVKVEYQTQRVLTNRQIAELYGCSTDAIKHNFRRAKKNFIEGKHYFKIEGEELKRLKEEVAEGIFCHQQGTYQSPVARATHSLILYTKQGVARHCKMLNTETAWEVFDELSAKYFEERPQQVQSPIVAIGNVHCYLDKDGTAWLNAEDVARGLGWVEYRVSPQSGEKISYVRWARLNTHLKELGYQPSQKSCDEISSNDFLPENVFYRLIWKSRDEKALKFQSLVADEILPNLRRHGSYSLNQEPAVEESISPEEFNALKEQVLGLTATFNQWFADMQKQLNPYQRADKLLALADKIHDDEARDKILLKAANLFIGKHIF